MADPLIEARHLVRVFGGGRTWWGARKPELRAVDGVSLAVQPGTTLGIVGESGCGKSTLARMLVGLIAPTEGTIRLEGRPVSKLAGAEKRRFHQTVQLVFQDPIASLNPRKTVRQILEGPLEALTDLDRAGRRERVARLMDEVGLRPEFALRYPHEFSGGQAQRIGIARALAVEPRLIVLDEPVSALDVSVQAQVLGLLKELQALRGLTYLFISHDLAVVEALATDVMVMLRGRAVEQGPRRRVFEQPEHDYTRTLLAAVPIPGRRHNERL
ncbi:MAG: ABC transporter ATP-binding protein [Geminicoccaceae bacterium]|jgi:peptide/nickel transport system ATP-binding protein|nr:ABC transporter ATP-binding protein [Geminicoccaceae bacterium]